MTFDQGTITVSFSDTTGASGPFTHSYGGIEALGIQDANAGGEFDNGAYFGIDLYRGSRGVGYDVTGPSSSVPDSGATLLLLGVGLFGLFVLQRHFHSA